MTNTIGVKTSVPVRYLRIEVPVRCDEEDIPNDFPLRSGDLWSGTVDLETAIIQEWPKGGFSGKLSMKVCDEGTYTLLNEAGDSVAKIEQDYVPNGIVPGQYGDYIDLEIDENGCITNWPKNPDFSAFED